MSTRTAWLSTGVLAGLAGLCTAVHVIGHDQSYYLYVAQQMLRGATPYRDFVDPNLPTLSFLCLIPAQLALWTGASAIAWFKACGLALVAGAVALCARLLRHALPEDAAARRALLPVLIAGFGLAPFGFRGLDFGQREHLAVLCLTPYALAHAGRGRPLSSPAAAGVGALAALGLAAKPHFALVWLALEGWTLARAGSRLARVEVWIPPLLAGAYGLLCVALLPELRTTLLAAAEVYPSYREGSYANMLGYPDALLSLAVLALHALWPGSGGLRDLRRSLALALVGWWTLAVLQRGWDYHFLPAAATSVLLGAAVLLDRDRAPRRWRAALAAGLLLGGLWSSAAALRSLRSPALELGEALAEAGAAGAAAPPAVWVISTSGWPAFPSVVYGGLRWASRFPCLWFLPGLYPGVDPEREPFPYHPPAAMSALEAWFFDAMLEDLASVRPDLVLVDVRPWQQAFGRTSFDYLAYLGQDERFREQWCGYAHLVRWRDWLDVYQRDPERARSCASLARSGSGAPSGLRATHATDTPTGSRARSSRNASSR